MESQKPKEILPHKPNDTKKGSGTTWTGFMGSVLLLTVALGLFTFLMTRGRDDKPPLGLSAPGDASTPPSLAQESSDTSQKQAGALAQLPQDSARLGPNAAVNPPTQSEPHTAPLNPSDEGDIHKALEALDQGNTSEAAQLLEGVLKRDPLNERALVEMAMMQLLDLKQPEQAVGYLQRAYEVNPANPMVMNELISLFEEQGKINEGIDFFTTLSQKNTTPSQAAEVAYGAGQMLTLAGKDQEALAYLQKAVDSGQGSPRALGDLAETYSRLGERDKAIDSYQKTLLALDKEAQDQAAKGIPPQSSAERISYVKMQLAREYLKAGQASQAQALVDEVKDALPGDEAVAALQKQIRDLQGPQAKS